MALAVEVEVVVVVVVLEVVPEEEVGEVVRLRSSPVEIKIRESISKAEAGNRVVPVVVVAVAVEAHGVATPKEDSKAVGEDGDSRLHMVKVGDRITSSSNNNSSNSNSRRHNKVSL